MRSTLKGEAREVLQNKKCKKCLIVKDVSYFTMDNYNIDGYRYNCKECVNESSRKRYYEKQIEMYTSYKKRIDIS